MAQGREKSLKIHLLNDRENDFRSLRKAANLSASPVILEPGVYTCSFYAKSDAPDAYLNLWASRFRSGSVYGNLRNAMLTVRPGKEWKRYSFSFEVNLPKPVILNMNAVAPSKRGTASGSSRSASPESDAIRSASFSSPSLTSIMA